jgi:type VI secretion system protein ImpI
MYLSLQIISPNGAALGPNINKVFGEAGGTIGRAQGNDWVLPDPDRFISSRHAIVRCMGGMYSLEDVSVNGVFMNDQTTPVGAGSDPVILQNGDRIQIGDYQVQVSIVEEAPAGMDVGQRIDPLTTSPTGPITSPTTTPTGGASTIGPVDPLDLLGDAPPAPAAPEAPPSFPDHSAATSDYFAPPAPAGGGIPDDGAIPDDWDLTDFSPSPQAPPPPQPAAPPQAPAAPPPIPESTPAAMQPQAPSVGGGADQALFDQLMPLIVQGMMDVLKSRAEIKSEFRLALTTIKPVENNPLKFSPTAQDAMQHLFGGGQTGYLNPIEAFEEGFNDIKAHQMAMIAGMRAAFEYMLSQFSPELLEEKFEGGSKRGGIMSMANKVRYWEMYRHMFDRITRDSDDNFRQLFGEEFATAYEQQMQQITRKT